MNMKVHRLSWLAFVCALLMVLSVSSYAFASDLFVLQSPVDRELESISTESSETEVDEGVAEEESVHESEAAETQVSDGSDLGQESQQIDSYESDVVDPSSDEELQEEDSSKADLECPPTPSNSPPIADAGGPYYANIEEDITFDGSGSYDPDGEITGYRWDFENDGNYDTGWLSSPYVTHSYSISGDKTIKLQVKDDGDYLGMDILYDEDLADVYINFNPVAIIDPSVIYAKVNDLLTFYGSNSSDPDGYIDSYEWFIQNEEGNWEFKGNGVIFETSFDEVDSYWVRLYVYDDDEASDYTDSIVYIDNGESPLAVVNLTDYGEVDQEILFDGSLSWDPDGSIIDWSWDFGDENTGSGKYTTHNYTSSGGKMVTLIVTDDDGNEHSVTDIILISSSDGAPYSQSSTTIPINSNISPYNNEASTSFSIYSANSLKIKILQRLSKKLSSLPDNSLILEKISSKLETLSNQSGTEMSNSGINFTIAFSYTPYPCEEDEPITFNGYVTHGGTPPFEYFWDFENDATWDEYSDSAVHVYNEPGNYIVVFKVKDSNNLTETVEQNIEVLEDTGVGVVVVASSPNATTTISSTTSSSFGNLSL
jgi:PKD repeat protein